MFTKKHKVSYDTGRGTSLEAQPGGKKYPLIKQVLDTFPESYVTETNPIAPKKKTAAAVRKSCWDCSYQNITDNTFLGTCTWFSKNKSQKDKEIPPEVVDVGCKHFVQKGI